MVPNQFCPHIPKSSQPVSLDKQNILGTICPGGPNWLGTIYPWGPNFLEPSVNGDQIGWGLFVQTNQSIGVVEDKISGDICIRDQMCHSRIFGLFFENTYAQVKNAPAAGAKDPAVYARKQF